MLRPHRERLGSLRKLDRLRIEVHELELLGVAPRGLGGGAGDAVERDGSCILDVVDLLVRPLLTPNHVGHRNGKILHVPEPREVLAVAGDDDRAPRVDALKEILLNRVVVLGAADVGRADGAPVEGGAEAAEVGLGLELALVARLGVDLVDLEVGHLLRLLVHPRTAHVHKRLERGPRAVEEVSEGGGVGPLAAVHVVHVGVGARVDEAPKLLGVRAVADDALGAPASRLELRVALPGDDLGQRPAPVV
mmetsp:Transcript_47738/g.116212  ORF Transcript_47738/g.116212 Transcript_47738/m.116212 type:complete len:249 (-) Transcript_47738:267-1013(-)